MRPVNQALLGLQVHLVRAFRAQRESQASRDHQAPEVSQEKALQERRGTEVCLVSAAEKETVEISEHLGEQEQWENLVRKEILASREKK